MRVNSCIFIAMLMVCGMSIAHAQIYTCKDKNGNKIYTDSPSQCANAEEIKTDALPTLVPTKPLVLPSRNSSANIDSDKYIYKELEITSPTNDSTSRNNQGNLTINFRVAPGLRSGHKFVVSVSGKEVYTGTSTIAALKNVDRGTHSIGVKVVDADGSTKISAAPVKVTLQRFSALQNPEASTSDTGDNNGTSNDNEDSEPNISNQSFPRLPKLPRQGTPAN